MLKDYFNILVFFFFSDVFDKEDIFFTSSTCSVRDSVIYSFFEDELFDFLVFFFSELLNDLLLELFDFTVSTIASATSLTTSFFSFELSDVIVFFFSELLELVDVSLTSSTTSTMPFLLEDDFDVLVFFSMLLEYFDVLDEFLASSTTSAIASAISDFLLEDFDDLLVHVFFDS